MAVIKIDNLNPVGSEFFNDSESYLTELTEDESNMTSGGWFFAAVSAAAAVYGVLPDAQKQWVNRRFLDAYNIFIKPIPVY